MRWEVLGTLLLLLQLLWRCSVLWLQCHWLPNPPLLAACSALLLRFHTPSPTHTDRDDVEDLCNAAVKEEAIEVKLRAVAEQWAQEIFTFADHKARGPVVLKVRDLGGWVDRWQRLCGGSDSVHA